MAGNLRRGGLHCRVSLAAPRKRGRAHDGRRRLPGADGPLRALALDADAAAFRIHARLSRGPDLHRRGEPRAAGLGAFDGVPDANPQSNLRSRSQPALAAGTGDAAARRRLHLHLQRGGGDPRAHHDRRAGAQLSPVPGLDARRRAPALAGAIVPEGRLRLHRAQRQPARQGRQYQQRPRPRRGPGDAARLRRDPRRGLRSDARFPHPRPDAVQEEDVGVVQTPQNFANPDPMQSNLSLSSVWPDEQRYFFDVIMASKDAWAPPSAAARPRSSASRRCGAWAAFPPIRSPRIIC